MDSSLSKQLLERNMLNASEMTMLNTFLSACDQDTYEHSYRIAHAGELVARTLQLSEEEVCLVYLAGLLHDIGKISIPTAILKKRGPLDDDEQRIMRLHPQIGQNMLTQAGGIFESLAAIVVAHHERWDGLGYPDGLKQEAIPLLARIVTVVDSFDAMTSSRGYRMSLSEGEAYRELEHCAGSQYDPRVVAAFLSIRDDTWIASDVSQKSPLFLPGWFRPVIPEHTLYGV
jgi:putative nucleotidyltransferase with HDIG domain